MLVRFITNGSDFTKVLLERENEDFVVLKRRDGFFSNRTIMQMDSFKDATIYTDDETMLNYVPFVDGKYNIEFKFPECDEFISIMNLHPNLRKSSDLVKMFHAGIFHEDFHGWSGWSVMSPSQTKEQQQQEQ